jgi:predicted RNA methylase
LDIPSERIAQAERYQPVAVEEFEAAMRDLPINHKEYVFVDLGCGKGRALLLASRFPFQRALGVEISAFLAGVAEENVRRFQDHAQRCHTLDVLCQDASTYELPRDRLVLHLYNPFGAEIMRTVVANAEASLREFPRDIYVVYIRHVHEEVWNASALFRLVRRTPSYVVYRSTIS